MDKSAFVVSADWVEKQLGAPEFRIVDASWYLPAQKRNGAVEYAEGHIPGAVFFDQDAISDHSTGLPHSIPSDEFFSAEMGKLGIADTDTIVVHDGPGMFTAPRVWWLLRSFGARKVFVMEGGIDGWKAEGRPTTSELSEPRPAIFHAHLDRSRVASFDDMMAIVSSHSAQIADARSLARFAAEEPEPRAGMRGGHMPGARSVPISVLSLNGRLKSLSELHAEFTNAGIDLNKPVVTSCGSGITAAVITLALESLGHSSNRLYDGSWSEWGGRPDTPIETGRN